MHIIGNFTNAQKLNLQLVQIFMVIDECKKGENEHTN